MSLLLQSQTTHDYVNSDCYWSVVSMCQQQCSCSLTPAPVCDVWWPVAVSGQGGTWQGGTRTRHRATTTVCVCLLRSVPRHHHRGPVFVSPQSIFSSHVSTSIETSSTTTLPSVTTPNIPVHQTTHQPWPQCSILQSSSCISVYMCLSSWKWTVTAPFLHPNPLSPNLRLNLQPDPVKVHPKHLLPLSKWQPHSQDDGNRPSHKRNQVRLEMIKLFVCPGPGLMNDCLLWECLPVCRLAMWHGHYSLVTRSTHCQSNNDGQLTYRKAISFSLTSVFHKSKFLFHLKRSLR